MTISRRPAPTALAAVFTLMAAIAISLIIAPTQLLTGDETRYLMYAVSIWRTGSFQMTLPDWQSLYSSATHSETPGLPVGADGVALLNSVYVSTVLAPVARLFSLAGLRAAALIAGLFGLLNLFRLCQRAFGGNAALLATAVAGLSLPLLPYLHLFYMEAFLFALVCWGWDRLQAKDRLWGGDLATAAVILAIPFVHMRGSAVAAALYALLLWQLYRAGRRGLAACLLLMAIAAFGLLIGLNLAIYGSVTGPVNSARPPMPWELPSVLAMQLFNVHHGLLAYAPVWLLGFAGLGVAAVRGPAVGRQGLGLAVIAATTSIGVNPGECWPARFWVLSIPMLAVGTATWWNAERRLVPRLVGGLLIGFSLVNSAIFFLHPNDFLENRQTTATYQSLFYKTGHVHFGLGLPVEVDDASNRDAARNLAFGAGLIVVLMSLSALRHRTLYGVAALLLLAAIIDLARVRVVPPTEYRATVDGNRLTVVLTQPMAKTYVQFGGYWETWSVPPGWPNFALRTTTPEGTWSIEHIAANQVVAAACQAGIASIVIDSPDGFDMRSAANQRLIVYQSISLVGGFGRWVAGHLPVGSRACQSKGSEGDP